MLSLQSAWNKYAKCCWEIPGKLAEVITSVSLRCFMASYPERTHSGCRWTSCIFILQKKPSKGPQAWLLLPWRRLVCVGHTAGGFKSQATQTSGPSQASVMEDCPTPEWASGAMQIGLTAGASIKYLRYPLFSVKLTSGMRGWRSDVTPEL